MDKTSRLRRGQDFTRVRREGRTYRADILQVGVAPNGLTLCRFGFAVGKRVGSAVTRNLVKRRAREIARALLPSLRPGWDIVASFRPAAGGASFATLSRDMRLSLQRARILVPDATQQSES